MKICPKCESEGITLVGIDKTLTPQLIERGYIGVGDFYTDIQILQCANCGCRFLNMPDESGGFIKSIATESSAGRPKTFKLKTVSYQSLLDIHSDDRKNIVNKLMSEEVSLEDLQKKEKEPEKRTRKSSKKVSSISKKDN